MNATEKLAATYLRLNGFLLLPHFTIFTGDHHSHIDLIGLHPMNGVEKAGADALELLIDDRLFEKIQQHYRLDPKQCWIGIVAEVKTNEEIEIPSQAKLDYARLFLGDAITLPISFTGATIDMQFQNGTICIGLNYAFNWILKRIDWMEQRSEQLSKKGSWNWSEEFLADILVFKNFGFYRE